MRASFDSIDNNKQKICGKVNFSTPLNITFHGQVFLLHIYLWQPLKSVNPKI